MYYSQKSYPKVKLGTCSDTIAQSGCIITSACNLLKRMDIADITPDKMNALAKANGWYSQGCLLDLADLAAHFGCKYVKQIKAPKDVCMFETNYYKKVGVPQHFCLINPASGKRLDPLDLEPSWEANNYPIVSYRIFTKIKPTVEKVDNMIHVFQEAGVIAPQVITEPNTTDVVNPENAKLTPQEYAELPIEKTGEIPVVYPTRQETGVTSISKQTTKIEDEHNKYPSTILERIINFLLKLIP